VPNIFFRNKLINPLFADTAGIYAHPTPENKRKAVEVLAAVFGGESVEEDIQVPDMRDLPYSRTNN